MILLHFALPYALLLSRDIKRDWQRLRVVADVDPGGPHRRLLLARGARSSTSAGLSVGLLDFALPIAIGGIFLALFAVEPGGATRCCRVNDPGLPKALAHHVH